MRIRVLNETDAKSYQNLRLSALLTNPEAFGSTYEREAAFSLDTVAERIKPAQDQFVLGAFDYGGSLVGIVSFVRDKGPKTAHKGHVYGMYVSPGARGQGAGKALLLELIHKAKNCNGLEQINLTVMSENVIAKQLYLSLGFTVYGVERNALKVNGQYFDVEFMVLKL